MDSDVFEKLSELSKKEADIFAQAYSLARENHLVWSPFRCKREGCIHADNCKYSCIHAQHWTIVNWRSFYEKEDNSRKS